MTLAWLAAVFFVCQSPAAAPVKNPDTYVYLSNSEPDSLDAAWAQDTPSMNVLLNVYETLFKFRAGSLESLEPLLATQVPSRENGLLSADGRVYTIPIRADVRFHDGTLMTADDAAYSIKRFLLSDRPTGPSWLLLNPLIGRSSTRDEKGQPIADVWAEVDRAVQVKGEALILTLPRSFAPLLSILGARAPVVVSKKWAAANGGWDGSESSWRRFNNPLKQDSPFYQRANGTGPFKLAQWDRQNHQVVLVRNEAYWRAPAKLKRVVFRGVPEFSTRKLMLQAGDADVIIAERPHLSQLRGLPGVEIIDGLASLGVAPSGMFVFKTQPVGNAFIGSGRLDGDGIPPDFFANTDVRQAFAYSMDYAAFIADVLGGNASQATGCIPKGVLGYSAQGPVYRLDRAEAERRLRRAFDGKLWETGFHLTLATFSGYEQGLTMCQMLKRNVESLNPRFRLDVRVLEWPSFLDSIRGGKLPFYVTGWSMKFPDPHDLAFAFLHSRGLYPAGQKFSDRAVDELVEQAQAEPAAASRQRLYERLQRLEFDLAPHIVVADKPLFRAQRSWVKGWIGDPTFPESPAGAYLYALWKE